MCRKRMRASDAPSARAAMMNSRSRSDSTVERQARAKSIQPLIPARTMRIGMPLPKAAIAAIAMTMKGIASCTSAASIIEPVHRAAEETREETEHACR